jgi:hypothetical protein
VFVAFGLAAVSYLLLRQAGSRQVPATAMAE